jgi:hypothetical protein
LAAYCFHLEVEGKPALGFNTGLGALAFAQAKMAQFITQPGFVVFPGGKTDAWNPSGTIEYPEPGSAAKAGERPNLQGAVTLVIWGPAFEGERLDLLVEDDSRKDEALNAIRAWTGARLILEDREFSPRPGGALVSPAGAVLFPPERLITRCLQAEGEKRWAGGEAYVHPDLTGRAATAFTAAAMLYRVFTGTPAFPEENEETRHQNIREGVFLPVELAAPGLEKKTAALINAALGGEKKGGGQESQPDPALLPDKLCAPPEAASAGGGSGAAAFFQALSEEEHARITEEAARYWKKKTTAVQTRRFVIRNMAVFLGVAAAVLVAVLAGRSIVKSRAALPSTAGMDSAQVVRIYYDSFSALDHQMMEAAVIQKAGKTDIEMVTNFFVISKVREAYEHINSPFIPAQEWRDAGSPPTAVPVFGVSDLKIEKTSEATEGEEIHYRASFILWLPASATEEAAQSPSPPSPESSAPSPEVPSLPHPFTDELSLIRHQGNWRIAEIMRTPQASY